VAKNPKNTNQCVATKRDLHFQMCLVHVVKHTDGVDVNVGIGVDDEVGVSAGDDVGPMNVKYP
jgi:hypothetical protein